MFREIAIAREWARELGKYKGHEQLVSKLTMWGFAEVERGRHPDTVLKEMLAKIEDRICQSDARSPAKIAAPSSK